MFLETSLQNLGLGISSAKPPAMTSFAEPMALNPALKANGTVKPSLKPCN